ncbi:hypothetical protein [Nocardioides convexus]|uniref:hypothetical protein n=1 Tax=Nocardioides convexus TaxID=2712224 RepID=UPI0024186CAB|nr:hypothetical protein [Nocardioides convexus]
MSTASVPLPDERSQPEDHVPMAVEDVSALAQEAGRVPAALQVRPRRDADEDQHPARGACPSVGPATRSSTSTRG